MAGGIVAPDVQYVELAGVGAGDRLETADAFKLAFVRAIVIEGGAVDDLHRAPGAEGGACQPNFAVAAVPNPPDEFMVGNDRRWEGCVGYSFRRRSQRAAEVV